MEVTLEKLSPILVELRVELPSGMVQSELNEAYNQLRKKARIRGFRRGKAPRKILQQLYGPAVHADVTKRLVDRTLQDAMLQKDVQPLSKPDIVPAELVPNSAFSFKARFEVRPVIEKIDWEGLVAKRSPIEVKDEQIDEEIERLRREHATVQPIAEPRAAKRGDIVSVKLSFDVNGEPHTEEIDAELGAGQFLPYIDSALEGMKVGDEKEVVTRRPDDHPNPAIRGTEAKVGLVVVELKERVLPEVDDEFAKDCGEYDDLAALRSALKEKLTKAQEQQAEEDLARQLVTQLCVRNPIPVPPSLVQQQIAATERELEQYTQLTGQRFNPTPEQQRRIREEAEGKVQAGLLMAEIAKLKSLKVGDADLEEGYAALAAQSGKNVAKIRAEYRDRQKREMLIGMILENKVLDLIQGSAKIEST